MQFEVVNLGSDITPQNINLGKNCPPEERQVIHQVIQRIKDIFTWTYEDLKTYDTNIHTTYHSHETPN
jgi:hypothetical protein